MLTDCKASAGQTAAEKCTVARDSMVEENERVGQVVDIGEKMIETAPEAEGENSHSPPSCASRCFF